MGDVLTGLGESWCAGNFDGICGMAFSALSDGLPPPMGAIVKSGLSENVFAFYLGHEEAGELVIGGVDRSHYSGDFITVPLVSDSYWQVALTGIQVGSQAITPSVTSAIIDSGTSLLVGPTADVSPILDLLGAQQYHGNWLYNCSTPASIKFELGGSQFALSASDIALEREGDTCVLGIQGSDDVGPLWILGDVFMRRYYVKFDWCGSQVGIAEARKTALATDLVV